MRGVTLCVECVYRACGGVSIGEMLFCMFEYIWQRCTAMYDGVRVLTRVCAMSAHAQGDEWLMFVLPESERVMPG